MPHKDLKKRAQYHKEYWQKNKDRHHDMKLKRDFGISALEYEKLLINQHGVCAICFQPETAVHARSKTVQALAVDHDHKTKVVRGLLCSKCNTALGLLNEDPARAQSLIAYLQRHHG